MDEEMFISTQQIEDGGDGDHVYLELAKAIAERKCRTVQKKEKLILMINEMKKQNEKFKSAVNEKKFLMKEIEDVSNQKYLRVQNIKSAQESRAALETTLSDLNNKASLEKAETKRQKDEFDSAIKDAYETWDSYKEKYESLPLSKKRQNLEIEVKKVEIKLKQAHMDILDLEIKKRLKHQLAEKRFHLSVVELAKRYFIYQKKVEEHKELQEKVVEMKKRIADLKSGKITKNQSESSKLTGGSGSSKEEQVVQSSTPKFFAFTLPGMSVISPPPAVNEDDLSRGSKVLDWSNLLGSTGLLGFSKKPAKQNMESIPNISVRKQISSVTVSDEQSESVKEKSPYDNKRNGSSLKLTNLLRNLRKSEVNVGCKRSYESKTKGEPNEEETTLPKKMCTMTQITDCSDTGEIKPNETAVKEKPTHSTVKQGQTNKDSLKENKENTNPRVSNNSSEVKSHMPSLVQSNNNKTTITPTKSKAMSQNLMNILSLQDTGNQKKCIQESVKDIQKALFNSKKFPKPDQQKNYREGDFFQNVAPDRQKQQFEDIQVSLEPGSPAPDLIPVESNSQPLSQGNISQTYSPGTLNLSGGSDFISPNSEGLDEDTELIYERLAAEAPIGEGYSRGGEKSVHKSNSENNTVRSQYFIDVPSLDTQSRNTPLEASASGYQSSIVQPYSPVIDSAFDDNTQLMNNIPSPPPGNAGAFGGSGIASGFNFMPSAPKSKSSIFDFF